MSTGALTNLLEIRLHWAALQCWPAGEQLLQTPNAHSLWLVLEGEVFVQSRGQEWRVGAHQAFCFPAGIERLISVSRRAEWLTAGLHAATPGHTDLLQTLGAPALWSPDEAARQTCETTMRLLLPAGSTQTQSTHDGAGAVMAEGAAHVLFGWLWRERSEVDLTVAASRAFPGWLQAALRIIHAQPEINVNELARATGISAAQLRRRFHDWLDVSPQQYLQQRRLLAARELLENTEITAQEIAARLGFSSAAHFSRLLKKSFGQTPLQVRRAAREPKV